MPKQEKPMTKNQLIENLSNSTGLAKKDVRNVLEQIVTLAHSQARVGFVIPDIGKLVIVHRKARMGFNPATGQKIKISARKALKFRISSKIKKVLVPKK